MNEFLFRTDERSTNIYYILYSQKENIDYMCLKIKLSKVRVVGGVGMQMHRRYCQILSKL